MRRIMALWNEVAKSSSIGSSQFMCTRILALVHNDDRDDNDLDGFWYRPGRKAADVKYFPRIEKNEHVQFQAEKW